MQHLARRDEEPKRARVPVLKVGQVETIDGTDLEGDSLSCTASMGCNDVAATRLKVGDGVELMANGRLVIEGGGRGSGAAKFAER